MCDPFELFKAYVAVRAHFTSTYDLSKGRGYEHIKIERSAYLKRKDKPFFVVLSKKVSEDFMVPFFVSLEVHKEDYHVSDIVQNMLETNNIFERWKDRARKLKDIFFSDLLVISKEFETWHKAVSYQGMYPGIFNFMLSRRINPETYALLTDVLDPVFAKNKKLQEDSMFSGMNYRMRKYRRLISLSRKDLLSMIPRDLNNAGAQYF